MNLIFCKASYHRRREFQVYTKVYQSDHDKFVEKESIYPEGKTHIHKMAENREALVSLYGDSYAVAPCELDGDVIRFPYVEGETLEESMISALRKDALVDTTKEQLNYWIDIIKGSDSNLSSFIMTPEFNEVFGDAEELVGSPALQLCNFDCNCDNIIIDKNLRTIIDYEWVFKFPVPLELVLYRLILPFYSRHSVLIDNFEIQQILDICGIHSPLDILERLCDNFYNNIRIEKDSQVNMNKIGRLNTTSPIVPVIYDRFFYATIYFDTGEGFSEKEKKSYTFLQTENSVNWDCILPKGCISLRFDPVEQFHCIVSRLKIMSGNENLRAIPLNGIYIGEYIYFENNDPQILIELPKIHNKKINIQANILPFYGQNYFFIAQEIRELVNGLEHAQERLESTKEKLENIQTILNSTLYELLESRRQEDILLKTNEELKRQAEESEIAYVTISNAFFWKITWPARALLDKLKTNIKRK